MQFIERIERFKQQDIVFNEFVPFALLSGLPEQFGKKIEKFGVLSYNTNWFPGNNNETLADFTTRLSIFSDSMSSAIDAKAGDIPASHGILHLQSKDHLEKRSKGNNKL